MQKAIFRQALFLGLITLGLSFGFSSLAEARGKAKLSRGTSKLDPNSCSAASLDRKNCILEAGKHRLQFRDDTINSYDGVHRRLIKLPIAGHQVEWKSINKVSFGNRNFILVEIWDAPARSSQVSVLQWLVYEIEGVNLELKLSKIIQRRKAVVGSFKNNKKYEMDKVFEHRIYKVNNQIHWTTGFKSGVIK